MKEAPKMAIRRGRGMGFWGNEKVARAWDGDPKQCGELMDRWRLEAALRQGRAG